MSAHRKENRLHTSAVLIEQFLRKGYQCREIRLGESTLLVLTHDRRSSSLSGELKQVYAQYLKPN